MGSQDVLIAGHSLRTVLDRLTEAEAELAKLRMEYADAHSDNIIADQKLSFAEKDDRAHHELIRWMQSEPEVWDKYLLYLMGPELMALPKVP